VTYDDAFARSLGRLILAFADAESAVFDVLRAFANVSPKVARAIFSGSIRMRTMIEFIENIAHNTNVDEKRMGDLRDIFAQLAAINTARDRLIHFAGTHEVSMAQTDSPQKVITNKARVGRAGNEFTLSITAADLEHMRSDLILARLHLIPHAVNPSTVFEPAPERRAWLYKPEPPNRKKDNSQQVPESPKSPRKSSPR
jgi:hypothetical protein